MIADAQRGITHYTLFRQWLSKFDHYLYFGFRPFVSNRHRPAPALFQMIFFK
jgi:hypothetical protein